ncbi:MAG: sigma-70 family RNA polymerase sigma factor [Planctomycetota bacterium]
MNPDLMDLVKDARGGDQSAIASVMEAVLPEVRAYVRVNAGARIRARESATDLVQSICREILEDIGGFRGTGTQQFRNWLFTLALNKIRGRHRFRAAARRDAGREVAAVGAGSQSTGFDELLNCYSRFYTPSRVAKAREEVSRVEAAMEELPDDYREVITLSCIVGLHHRDVAHQMNRSETAVRKLLSRARARLALLLATGPATDS